MLNVKIKLCCFLLLTFIALGAMSQSSSDSTQIKLEQYKKLYDSGVIGEDEYNKMKAELLSPAKPVIAAPGTANIKAVDSIQIKLDQNKKLFDSGVISEDEYNKTKALLLGKTAPETKTENKPDPLAVTKVDTMSLPALKERYKAKIVAGSIILSVGTAFWVGDVLLATVSTRLNPTDSLYSQKVSNRRGSEIGLGILGGVASVGGAVFLALGLKDRAIYRRRGKELTLNFTGKEIQIALAF